MTESSTTRLLVFSDDWERHPSSCQHLIRTLLPQFHTTWVNTIGMRPPRLDWITVQRGLEKLRGWSSRNKPADSSPEKALPDGLTVIDAKMWPWMTHRWDRSINRKLLLRQLAAVSQDAIAITTIPIVADLVDELPVKHWVYYCVDDFSVWPGLDGKMLGEMEEALLPKVDRIVAASDNLAAGIRRRGYDAPVVTHGVDLDFWQSDSDQADVPWLDDLQRPICLFWGVVDRRMNADWLLSLAERMDQGTIVLAGPQQDPDPRLAETDRIVMPGPVPFESLPALAPQAAVLIMPYADLPVTRAMQPLKLKEYLATGVPVVAASLPAVRAWETCLDLASTTEQFVEMTITHLQCDPPSSSRAKIIFSRLANESWQYKAEQFREFAL